jgi:hypothetical protein
MLVMFVHPRCPCTRASLSELNAIANIAGSRVSTAVVFLRPEGMPGGWERTDSWSSAARIPGATLLSDHGGIEAARFGADTSGYVVLYDPEGRLLFSGGITGSRGQAGDNWGRRQVLSLVMEHRTDRLAHAVYGCPLHDAPSDEWTTTAETSSQAPRESDQP